MAKYWNKIDILVAWVFLKSIYRMLSSLRIKGIEAGMFFCSLMSVSEAYLLTQFDIQYISMFMVPYGMVLLVQYLMVLYLMAGKFCDCFPANLFLLAASLVHLSGNGAEARWLFTFIEFLKCLKTITHCSGGVFPLCQQTGL